jgi:uncharacterized phage protein gp47/JayE
MITPSGFTRPTLDAIREQIKDAFRTKFTEIINGITYSPSLEPESFLGALAEILAEVKNDLYQDIEDSYYSNFLTTANGVQLDRIALPTTRKAAIPAKAEVTFTGVPGTVIPAGFLVETEDKRRYALDQSVTIGAGGTITGTVTAVVPGKAGNAPQHALTFMPVPLDGLTTVDNLTPAVNGADIETDSSLRRRAIDDRSNGITSSLSAILGRVLQVPGVVDARGVENTTLDYIGIIPPGGFEITVRGGADQDIAQAILASRPAGIVSAGSVSVTVYDVEGNPHVEKFSRVVDVPIYVLVTLTVNVLYNQTLSNDVVRQRILEYIGGVNPSNESFPGVKIGENVLAWKAKAMLFDVNNPGRFPGLVDATVKLSKVPSPINQDEIVIQTHEEAVTDFSNISLVVNVI